MKLPVKLNKLALVSASKGEVKVFMDPPYYFKLLLQVVSHYIRKKEKQNISLLKSVIK